MNVGMEGLLSEPQAASADKKEEPTSTAMKLLVGSSAFD